MSAMNDEYPKIYLYRRIVQAKLFIDRHYAEAIDIDKISDEACFSKFHFIRVFKTAYGRTPHQYLTYVRINKAQEMLKGGKNVSEVCSQLGFESLSTFSGLFRKSVGQTPSSFLDNHKKQQAEAKRTPLKFIPNCFISNHGLDENSNFEETDD